MTEFSPIDHAEATELAGLYVLGALQPSIQAAVEDHLAACPDAHLEFDELGSVLPTLALLAGPVEAPPLLRTRVIAAVLAEARRNPRRR